MKKSSYVILFIALIAFFSLYNSLFLTSPLKLSAIFGVIIVSIIESFPPFLIIVLITLILNRNHKLNRDQK